MSDIELELLAFLGTDFGASVALEIGQDAVGLIFQAGAMAQSSILKDDFNHILRDLPNPNKKETA